jgi:hypothetical protein
MSPLAHRLYIGILVSIIVVVTLFLAYYGIPYYKTPIEERFYHPDHDWFKPSGIFGHGLGIVGTLLILIGVFGYMAKKKYRFLDRLGRLKYWLEFHIFLCTLGPIMILFHTAFKFGGIVSVSFWSMVAVVASGVIGRFIYIRIPRTIEGRALSLHEIKDMKSGVERTLAEAYQLDMGAYRTLVEAMERVPAGGTGWITRFLERRKIVSTLANQLKERGLSRVDRKSVLRLVKNEMTLSSRIEGLQTMQKLFKYWHVAHLPFALIMLIIMVIHVGVTLAFGYRWIF